jgi:hypothetical protein
LKGKQSVFFGLDSDFPMGYLVVRGSQSVSGFARGKARDYA